VSSAAVRETREWSEGDDEEAILEEAARGRRYVQGMLVSAGTGGALLAGAAAFTGRGLQPLNVSLLCPFPLNLNSLRSPYNPN
jgi:hypothetical protein